MGSTASSLSSSSVTAPVTFSGISTYSSDFQSILQRAVSIAQIPIQSLQNQESDNQDKINALQTLNPDVANLGSAVAALGNLVANGGALQASSSDSSIVSAVNVGATSPGTYTISNIESLASSASATTGSFGSSATTPVSADGNVQLTVGSKTYNLSLTTATNNLAGLAEAINNADAGVSATILTAAGDNYLSISANSPGQSAIQLQDLPATTDQITNTGTGTETSTAHYASSTTTPVSVSGNMSLVVGSNTYQLTLGSSNNNLSGLVSAINGANAGVTASIGTDSNGSYLSISTNDGSAQTIQLNDTPNNLITNSTPGSDAQFTLNGSIQVVEPNNTINDVIPGVSFTLNNTMSSGSVTLSLSNNSSQLSSALQDFVTDYNQLATDVSQDVGSSDGPLEGDLVISSIMTDMQQLVSYWNPNSNSTIRSLSDLGITFNDTSGQLTFDASVVSGLSDAQVSDAMNFLGSANSGFGALASNFTQLSDPTSGVLETEETAYQTEDTNLTNEIDDKNDQLTQMQSNLTAQLSAADAAVAELESEQNTLTASIESLNYVAYGVNYNSNGTAN